MPEVGLGHSTRSDPADASAEASAMAREALSGAEPDAAIVVATGAWGGEAAARAGVARAVRELGTGEIVGAGLDGLMVGGSEWTGAPAVAVLALAGSGAETALVEQLGGHEEALAEELAASFHAPPSPGDLVIVLAEPQAADGRRLARSLQDLGTPSVAGIAAGEATGESQPVWVGEDVVRGGLAALRIPAAHQKGSRMALTQAGRPIGEPLRITRARGHWIAGLEDRPALDVYRAAVPAPLQDDLPRAAKSILVALEGGANGSGERGRRIRNVVGFDESRGAFSVAEAPAPGDRLALVALDGAAARDDLGRLEASLSGPPPAGALYLNCRARAQALFEHEGYELGRVSALAGGCPVLGVMGSHLYARASARPGHSADPPPLELHTYAALVALIDA